MREDKMTVRAINTYPFETEWLLGEIRCDVPKPTSEYKPGVVYLAHKGEPKPPHKPEYDLLPDVPRQALLMPEWLKKANCSDGIFWSPWYSKLQPIRPATGICPLSSDIDRDLTGSILKCG